MQEKHLAEQNWWNCTFLETKTINSLLPESHVEDYSIKN